MNAGWDRRVLTSKQKLKDIILTKANVYTDCCFFVNRIKSFQKVQQTPPPKKKLYPIGERSKYTIVNDSKVEVFKQNGNLEDLCQR